LASVDVRRTPHVSGLVKSCRTNPSTSHIRCVSDGPQANVGNARNVLRVEAILAVRRHVAEGLGGSIVRRDKLVAPRTQGMFQSARNGINACGITIGFLRHPTAGLAMDQTTLMTDQQDWRVRRQNRHIVPLRRRSSPMISDRRLIESAARSPVLAIGPGHSGDV
jgi:hypothetical protein